MRIESKLPAAAYTCNANGLITYFNERAVELWGRAPTLNDPVDRFCGSFKLFAADGTPITHDRCWMALALETGREYCGSEILVQRPDGSYQMSATGPMYRGPGAPANGPMHHYMFEIYALDTKLDVQPGADAFESRTNVMKAMQGHILGKAVYGGLFKRPQ